LAIRTDTHTPARIEWHPGRLDISRILDHISSPPQDIFSGSLLLDINWLCPLDSAV